jgi:hypothetical protein
MSFWFSRKRDRLSLRVRTNQRVRHIVAKQARSSGPKRPAKRATKAAPKRAAKAAAKRSAGAAGRKGSQLKKVAAAALGAAAVAAAGVVIQRMNAAGGAETPAPKQIAAGKASVKRKPAAKKK